MNTYEFVDNTIVGAFRLVNVVSGVPLSRPLVVTAPGAQLVRNSQNDYVVLNMVDIGEYIHHFDPAPTLPAVGSLSLLVTIHDPANEFLTRGLELALPRDPDPDHRAAPNSLITPQVVNMFPSPVAAAMANWAVIRVRVRREDNNNPLQGVLLRVLQNGTVLGRGLTDARGEAFVGVMGVPVTSWDVPDDADPGEVISTEINVSLQAIADQAASGIPDPDKLEAEMDDLTVETADVVLATGRHLSHTFSISFT